MTLKILKLLSLSAFVLLLFSCKTWKLAGKTAWNEYYKVSSIDSINNYYIVYIKGGDAKYKIVSKKEKTSGCNKIEVGKGYPEFVLEKLIIKESYLPGKYIYNEIGSMHYVPDCIKMDDEKTEVCRDVGLDNIYKTKNLRGLCYEKLPEEKQGKFFLPPLKIQERP